MSAAALTVEPLGATFGARVTGLRLAGADAAVIAQLHRLWLEHALLLFPGQHLSDAEQVAFARHFGDLEFELGVLSNVRADGSLRPDDGSDDMVKVLHGNMGWHADSTYLPVQAKGAVFSARVVPTAGGGTEWADMRAAWDALDAPQQAQLEGLSAHHSLVWSQARLGHVQGEGSSYSGYGMDVAEAPLRPLVKTHPETGRRSLAIGRHAHAVPGLSADASLALLDGLVDSACRPPRVLRHDWAVGDTVLWDNRCLLHRGLPWDMAEPRVMVHTRIAGDPTSEAGLA